MFAVPMVRTLLALAVLVEMFGFAYHSVLPAVARRRAPGGRGGMGMLSMMAGFGSLAGVMVLTALGNVRRKGLLLIGITLGYGAFLLALAASGVFPLVAGPDHGRRGDGGGLRRHAVDHAAAARAGRDARPGDRRLGVCDRLRVDRLPGPRRRRGDFGVQPALAATGALVMLTALVAAVAVPKLRSP